MDGAARCGNMAPRVDFYKEGRMGEETKGIDIIDFTDMQFSYLTKGQLQTVNSAQQKKNRLYKNLQQSLRRAKHRLVKNGVFKSEIYELTKERLTAEYEADVEMVKQNLLFYLHYSMRPDQSTTDSAPYVVNYALPIEERLKIVKEFYEGEYGTDYQRLFAAFELDTIAPQYLGELYAALYDHFYAKVRS